MVDDGGWWMMVDDLLCVVKCSNTVVTTTSTISSFMELNSEKYIGDVISENGSLDDTIQQGKLRGYSYIYPK